MNTAPLALDDTAVLSAAARWLDEGRQVALATVLATWGSSPRPVGSLMAINDAGGVAGSVSAGCVEAAVIHEAGKTLGDGEVRVLQFTVTHETAWSHGLPCGGGIEVYLEPVE